MPQCVQFRVIGDTYGSIQLEQPILVSEPAPPSACQGYLLLTPSEYAAFQSNDLWTLDPVQSGKFFGFSFTLILSVYLVAWGYGQLLNFLDSRR